MKVRLFALEEIAKIYSGVNVRKEEISEKEEGYPWVRVEDLRNREICGTSRRLTDEGAKRAKISPPGTVFFSRTGTIGKVGICKTAMAPSNNIIAVEFDANQIEPLYGMYCLLAFRTEFIAEARGAVYDSLNLSAFRKFVIPVPDLDVQRGLAQKLELVRKSEEQAEEMIRQAKASVHELFEQYFHEEVRQISGSSLVCLGMEAEIMLSTVGKKEEEQGEQFSYIATGELNDWEISCGDAETKVLNPSLAGRCRLDSGDIVMNRINQADRLGRCGLVPRLEEPAVFGLNTVRIRARKNELEPLYLFIWLTHPYTRHYIRANAKNSTSFQSSLSKQVITELPLPEAGLEKQKKFAEEAEKYFDYVRNAQEICRLLDDVRQINYKKIKTLYESAEKVSEETQHGRTQYERKRYWIAPSGKECFYDLFLECIQVPFREWQDLRVELLPVGVEMQFLDHLHAVSDASYGKLGHIRLKRLNRNEIQIISMSAAAGQEDRMDERKSFPPDDSLMSEQQDFGYVRQVKTTDISFHDRVRDFLEREEYRRGNEYSRFSRLPGEVKQFLQSLSGFQQAVYEEFLLAMQPLASHMAYHQMNLRAEKELFPEYGIQDVTATVHLLEHAGLLERRQGFYLSYYKEYKQGEERELILDHRGRPIPIDTWVWILPEG